MLILNNYGIGLYWKGIIPSVKPAHSAFFLIRFKHSLDLKYIGINQLGPEKSGHFKTNQSKG